MNEISVYSECVVRAAHPTSLASNRRVHRARCEASTPGVQHRLSAGFSYIELMIAMAMASAIILGLSGVVGQTLHSQSVVHAKNTITHDANFAMQRMTRATLHSTHLLLPLNDNPNTNWPEHIREQTIPATPPIGSSTLATAVLAITLAHDVDRDYNGIPDADNDGDGLFDEDLPGDNTNDIAQGILNIDDDGDGLGDEGPPDPDGDYENNDESGADGDDGFDGIDNDLDGNVDEDIKADMNADFQPGIAGVDDDMDGSVDEGNRVDDDEDGTNNEDWYDAVVYYLSGNQLMERNPVPWDTNASGTVTGADFITSVIADNVSRFRVERIASGSHRYQQIDLTLELTSPETGETFSVQTRIRVSGAL